MKFSVNVIGADRGLIERLTAATNRKLASRLKQLAAHHALRVRSASGQQLRSQSSPSKRLQVPPLGDFAERSASETFQQDDISASVPALDALDGSGSDLSPFNPTDDATAFDIAVEPVIE